MSSFKSQSLPNLGIKVKSKSNSSNTATFLILNQKKISNAVKVEKRTKKVTRDSAAVAAIRERKRAYAIERKKKIDELNRFRLAMAKSKKDEVKLLQESEA